MIRLLPLLLLAACTRPGPDPEAEARALQGELRRAFIASKSLGRFGEFGLFEQDLEKLPCAVPLSESNRFCDLKVVGKGVVRLRAADPDLVATDQIRPFALVAVEYQPDCDNARFDFKTVDNSLPRAPAPAGSTVWENRLLRVTWRRVPESPRDRCVLLVEAAEPLLARIREVGRLRAPPP